jgi:ADP-dependent NAD(P)H-hydrate dehydratase / NAD(P)H-hydrate epimerase
MAWEAILDDDGVIGQPRLSPPPYDTHKYARGSALVFSGPALHTGASRLTARAALGVGAGLVTIVGEPEALKEHAAHVTAIMLRPMEEHLSRIDDRVSAAAIGPGSRVNRITRETVRLLLRLGLPLVLDADALTCFSDDPDTLFDALHDQVVLTPHEGEFGRIFSDIDVQHRHHAAGKAALRSGAVVLLKGPETLVASPDGRIAINCHAAPWLATAGSGDVLAGLVCG